MMCARLLRSPIALAAMMLMLFAGATGAQTGAARPKVAVALGGGSARGLAHVGVLRWLEEHRIPIDIVTGTSMGGLVGGAYASGMTPDEIDVMLNGIDWDAMFGASRFQFGNVRRKRDLRAYPSHLEFGLHDGKLVPPSSLNNGQQVDLLLSRIAAGYYGITSFDELATPCRCVAVDLKTAQPVILGNGSFARAMRATMSLPLVFPPVENADQVLVDGGAMNNIPADVARGLGAAHVIAVNVGDFGNKTEVDASLLGLVMETLDAMMRANTRRAAASADVMIDVPLKEYGSLDWRRAPALIKEGYDAAQANSARLLPMAVSEAEWQQWRDARQARRRTAMPPVAFVDVTGAGSSDTKAMLRLLQKHVGAPFDLNAVEATIQELGGLDRYQALEWNLVERGSDYGLVITAREKSYAPPFIFLGISLENTTGNEFRFGLGGRYLAFDVLGSGTELRIDANIGSDPSVAMAWYRPILGSAFFFEPGVGVRSQTLSVIEDGHTTAAYTRTGLGLNGDIGLNVGRADEIRGGIRYGWMNANVSIGDPGLPEVNGEEADVHAGWIHDGQDEVVVPSRGMRVDTGLRYYLKAPFIPTTDGRETEGVTQLSGDLSWFRSLNASKRRRLFTWTGIGTSFNGRPLATEQFSLGGPMRMSAFSIGEHRGDHLMLGGGGYLQQIARLPDFLGGPVFVGGWVEAGSAFDHFADAEVDLHTSGGMIVDTLIGPVFGAVSAGLNGDSRFYIGIGRIFH
jgi:NTE family protein